MWLSVSSLLIEAPHGDFAGLAHWYRADDVPFRCPQYGVSLYKASFEGGVATPSRTPLLVNPIYYLPVPGWSISATPLLSLRIPVRTTSRSYS